MSRHTSKKKMTKKKKHASSIQKPEEPFRSWSNFPVVPNYMEKEGRTVTKSWRWPSRQCSTASKSQRPTLVEFHEDEYSPTWTLTNFEDVEGARIIGDVTMVVTGDCSPPFAYHSRRSFYATPYESRGFYYEPRWILGHCDLKEPRAPTQKIRLCNLIVFERKFYATSLQGSAVVIEEEEEGSDRFGITRVGGNAIVPSRESRCFREYMFEFDGGIMVVLLVSRESIEVVDDVEVFRLDVEKLLWVKVGRIGKLLWVKVGRIGNRALFVGDTHGCMWAEACETGFKRDCVYFVNKLIDDWMVFDMETGKISQSELLIPVE